MVFWIVVVLVALFVVLPKLDKQNSGTSGQPTTTPYTPPADTYTPPEYVPPALTQPSPVDQSGTIQDLVQRSFTAINNRDYAGWSATVTAQRQAQQSEADWLHGYQSTTDSAVTVTGITPTDATSAVIGLSFTSDQNPADAPPDLPVAQICWQMQVPVVNLGTDPRLDLPVPGSTTKTPC